MVDTFSDVLSDAASRSKFLVLGDTDHREVGIISAIVRPENMRAMAAQGVTHMFMERSAGASHVIDAYQDGRTTFEVMRTALRPYGPDMLGGGMAMPVSPELRQQFIDGMADAVRNAKEAGIRVHFVERGAGSEVLNEMAMAQASYIHGTIASAIGKFSAQDPIAAQELARIAELEKTAANTPEDSAKLNSFMTTWMRDNPADLAEATEGYGKLNEDARNRFGRARIDADKGLADEIRSLTGSGKAVVIYGAAHGIHAGDLDDHLPGSTRILVGMGASGLDYLRPGQADMMDASRAPDARLAEGVYLVDQGKYIRNNAAGLAEVCSAPGVDTSRLGFCMPGEGDTPEAPAGMPQRHQQGRNGFGGPGS